METKFYYNNDMNICADENWVIGYIIINELKNPNQIYNMEIGELVRAKLRGKFGAYGWFKCEVSDTIADKFEI